MQQWQRRIFGLLVQRGLTKTMRVSDPPSRLPLGMVTCPRPLQRCMRPMTTSNTPEPSSHTVQKPADLSHGAPASPPPPTASTTVPRPSASSSPTDASPTDATRTAAAVMGQTANRATRFVFLRTLPLAKHDALAPQAKALADSIESRTRELCAKHVAKAVDDRSAVHLHTTALAIATHETLAPHFDGDTQQLLNVIRAGFGAPLVPDSSMSEEDLLTLNDDQTLRPDFWVVRIALWFSFERLSAIRRMTSNMVADFGTSFETEAVDDVVAGLDRHTLVVKKCFYHRLCVEEGVPDLTSIFCALDRNLYAPINSSKHRIRFTLDKTMLDTPEATQNSTGQLQEAPPPTCEFQFVKIKK